MIKFCESCPQCAIVNSHGQTCRPPFQIFGVHILDLPLTRSGNKHVVVFKKFLTKWPLVFPVKDQKALTLVRLLVEEVIPTFGVPEALQSE